MIAPGRSKVQEHNSLDFRPPVPPVNRKHTVDFAFVSLNAEKNQNKLAELMEKVEKGKPKWYEEWSEAMEQQKKDGESSKEGGKTT